VPRQRAVHVDPQLAAWLCTAEGGLGVLDLVEDRDAAPVVRLAVERGPYLPGGALEQAHAQPPFELLDRLGRGGTQQSQVLCRLREAALLHDAGEQAHHVQPVHVTTIVRQMRKVL
jgi:hypothetical protein